MKSVHFQETEEGSVSFVPELADSECCFVLRTPSFCTFPAAPTLLLHLHRCRCLSTLGSFALQLAAAPWGSRGRRLLLLTRSRCHAEVGASGPAPSCTALSGQPLSQQLAWPGKPGMQLLELLGSQEHLGSTCVPTVRSGLCGKMKSSCSSYPTPGHIQGLVRTSAPVGLPTVHSPASARPDWSVYTRVIQKEPVPSHTSANGGEKTSVEANQKRKKAKAKQPDRAESVKATKSVMEGH